MPSRRIAGIAPVAAPPPPEEPPPLPVAAVEPNDRGRSRSRRREGGDKLREDDGHRGDNVHRGDDRREGGDKLREDDGHRGDNVHRGDDRRAGYDARADDRREGDDRRGRDNGRRGRGGYDEGDRSRGGDRDRVLDAGDRDDGRRGGEGRRYDEDRRERDRSGGDERPDDRRARGGRRAGESQDISFDRGSVRHESDDREEQTQKRKRKSKWDEDLGPPTMNPGVQPMLLKPALCGNFANGLCKKGDECSDAHGLRELAPGGTKPRLCPSFMAPGGCPRQTMCFFAHTCDELPGNFKNRLCPKYMSGNCNAAQTCRNAHGSEELDWFHTFMKGSVQRSAAPSPAFQCAAMASGSAQGRTGSLMGVSQGQPGSYTGVMGKAIGSTAPDTSQASMGITKLLADRSAALASMGSLWNAPQRPKAPSSTPKLNFAKLPAMMKAPGLMNAPGLMKAPSRLLMQTPAAAPKPFAMQSYAGSIAVPGLVSPSFAKSAPAPSPRPANSQEDLEKLQNELADLAAEFS